MTKRIDPVVQKVAGLTEIGEDLGVDYDANCGQEIFCDILPLYIPDEEKATKCYLALSTIIQGFAKHRADTQLAQDKIDHEASLEQERRAIGEWLDSLIKTASQDFKPNILAWLDFLKSVEALKRGKSIKGVQ